MQIAIAGNIGCGKTTLTKMLAQYYGWTPHYEPVADNPYLDDFYKDVNRWSFCLEIFFLKERFKTLLKLQEEKGDILLDRSIYEGVYVFVENNHKMGNLSDRDFETYMELFEQISNQIRLPDLMIYLRADISHLVSNIQKRGRGCEQQMQIEYLTGLNELYEDFIYKKYKGRVLTIDVNGLDYQHETKDFAFIIDKLDPLINGMFPLKEQE